MKATIFRTGTKIAQSSVGLGKLVINFPGGAEHPIALRIYRKRVSDEEYYPVSIRVFNEHLINNIDERRPLEEVVPVSGGAVVSADDDGNVIYNYTILTGITGIVQGDRYDALINTGATRVEVCRPDNVFNAGLYGSYNYPHEIGDMNFEQYAYLPFTTINCCYARRAYGSIEALKHRTDLVQLYLSGSRSLYGNIESLVASAATLTGLFVYDTKVSGSLNVLLEAMKSAGVRSRTFNVTGELSGVTYNGSSLPNGTMAFVFDENGNYSLSE